MKKYVLFLACIGIAFFVPSAQAQVTITRSAVEAVIGTSVETTTFASNNPVNNIQALANAEGANQTWDFTTLMYDAGTSKTTMTTQAIPADATGGTDPPFNTANFITTQVEGNQTSYSFQDLRSDGIYFIGATSKGGNNGETRTTTQPPSFTLPLPVAFGATWSSSGTTTTTAQGMTFTAQEQRNNEADAYGTIILPTGTFQVLRQKQVLNATASGFTTTATFYFWYSEDFGQVAAISEITPPFGGTTYTASYLAPEQTATPPPNSPPTGLLPTTGTTGVSTTPTLTWETVATATGYDLQVADNAAFTKTATVVVDEQGMTATSFGVTGLANATTYHWRVRARNEGGSGPWSATQTFETEAGSPVAPGAVTLSSPADGSADVMLTPTLSWEAIAEADTYHLQVATDAAFSNLVFEEGALTGTSQELERLATLTQHFWRVHAENAGGSGLWSAVRSFTTATNTTIERTDTGIPTHFTLHANYPNPFNHSTQFLLDLPQSVFVSLKVYDVLGRNVATLLNAPLSAGTHRVEFDAANLPGGRYFYRLVADDVAATRTMIVQK